VIVDDSCPIKAASTVEEIPRLIIRDANPCRIEWKDAFDAGSGGGDLETASGGVATSERLVVPCCEHRILVG
jgi:hypothetical protein